MKNLILILVASIFLSGCSFLPKLTMNRTTSTLPQKNEQSEKNERCSDGMKKNDRGEIIECTKGYTSNEKYKNVSERKFTIFEQIGNFISNLKGILGIAVIASIVVAFMGGGGVVVTIWSNLFGTATRGVKALVNGIQKGKKYVRENGSKYSEAERIIYQQGASDMLAKISEAIDDKQVKKMINLIRAEVE